MQEPLLFNESIQENIRYGNQAANEKDIFEASEKANCLNFIQNSIDYLYIPEVRIKIEREFEEGLRDLSGKYQQFGLVRDYLRTQPLVIEEKFLIRELIENANESFF
jgi:ATP-binding cassette subfamily B protein